MDMTMKMSNFTLAVAAMMAAGGACAQSYTLKVGGAYIDPRATSSDLSGLLPTHNPSVPLSPAPSGLQLEVMPKAALVFSIARSLDEHWEAEVLLGIPPKHDVKLRVNNPSLKAAAAVYATYPTYNAAVYGNGAAGLQAYASAQGAAHINAYDGKVVSTLTQFAPTAFLNYRFGSAKATFRPYLGVGVNYTKVKPDVNATGTEFYSDGKVKATVSDSFGLAFQMGASYQITPQWLLNAAWATAAVRNDIVIRTEGTPGSEQRGFYRFHPSIFMLTAGYKF